MNPPNTSPFNLERALAGDAVVTRGGEAVTQLVRFVLPAVTGTYDARYPLRGVRETAGTIQAWSESGRYYNNGGDARQDSVCDLFMVRKTKTIYLNIYAKSGIVCPYETEECAKSTAVGNGPYKFSDIALPVEVTA